MFWTDLIPGCFGKRDLVYANQLLDKERAIEMVKQANKELITKSGFEDTIRAYITSRGEELKINNLANHVEEQMKWVLKKNFIPGTTKILRRE